MAKKIKKTSKTKNQLAWEKEVKRTKALIRRAEKRGYVFDKKAISVVTQKPKRISQKALGNLRETTKAKNIYEYADYIKGVDAESGTVITVSGKEGRKIERQRAAQKGVITKAQNKVNAGQILNFVGDFKVIGTLKDIFGDLSGAKYLAKGYVISMDYIQDKLLTALENELEKYNFDSQEYKEYINHLQNDVENCRGNVLDIIYEDSAIEQVNTSIDRIVYYLKWQPLNVEEAKEIGEMASIGYFGLEDDYFGSNID